MTGGDHGSAVFVGRADALGRVRSVAGARGSVGRTLVVSGPRGSGRTSLLRRALDGFDGDLMWLSGSPSSGAGTGAAVRNAGPAVQTVDDFARAGTGQLVHEALADGLPAAELGRLVTQRYRAMPHRERPVVVVADDVHLCDPYSLELVAFLAHRNHTFDVSYLLSAPDHALPEGLADLDRVELDGLTAPAAREALEVWTGTAVAAPVAATLTALTDGNPFLLREAGAALAPDQLEGRRTPPVRVPASAASLALVKPVLDVLDGEELRALACFALGSGLPSVVLGHVAGPGPLAALLDRHLVDAFPGGYRVTRAALGWLAEARLGAVARQELAAALADAWSDLDPVRAALHTSEAGGDPARLLAVGRRALVEEPPATDDRMAESLAWALVGHADPPTTHDWLELTARAERAGHLLDAQDAFEQAVRAPVVDEVDLPTLTRWRGFLSQAADDRALAVPSTKLLSALELIRPAVVFETMTRTAWNGLLVGAHAQARSFLDRARLASRSAATGDRALWRLVDVSWQRATGTARAETLREAALRWRDSSSGRSWYDDFLLVMVLLEAGARGDAAQQLFEAGSTHRHAGRHAAYFLTAARLQLEVATWQVTEALRSAAALDTFALAGPVHVRGLGPALVRLETLAGLPEETLHREARAYPSEVTALARARAERQLVDGRHREAAVGFQALSRHRPPLPPEHRWFVLADLVEAQVAQGELAAARQTHRAAALAEPADSVRTVAARAAALVAPALELRPAFARALGLAEREDGLVGRARTLLALSRRLGQTGSLTEADRVRTEAALIFAHHGLEGWRRHALALAWDTPSDDGQGRVLNSRLDDHETAVVRLLLLGHKNKEVADRLYVSLRSLEKTLTQVYAKLGVASKVEMLALVRTEPGAAGREPEDVAG